MVTVSLDLQRPLYGAMNTSFRGNFSNRAAGLPKLVARTSVGLPAIHFWLRQTVLHHRCPQVVGDADRRRTSPEEHDLLLGEPSARHADALTAARSLHRWKNLPGL